MQGGVARVRRARGADRIGVCIAALASLVLVTGCATQDRSTSLMDQRSGPTVAFDSIDGPPPAVFNRLVDNLGSEAEARRIAVVSREGQAHFRVRGYLAAHVEKGRTHIGWAWDVYDAERRRTLRITGEELGAASRRPADAWNAADEQVLFRIARSSMERLAAFLAAPEAPHEAGPPPSPRTATASPPAGTVAVAASR